MAPNSEAPSVNGEHQEPDYVELVTFLLQPLLESSETIKADCEKLSSSSKVWLRLALEVSDKGKVFGRGGRNIQAVRAVLEASAALFNQSIYLDIYDSDSSYSGNDRSHSSSSRRYGGKSGTRKTAPRRKPRSRPSLK